MPASSPDRRNARRSVVKAPGQIILPPGPTGDGDRAFPAGIRDVSDGGLSFAIPITEEQVPVMTGTRLTVRFQVGNALFTLPARVVWTRRVANYAIGGLRVLVEGVDAAMMEAFRALNRALT